MTLLCRVGLQMLYFVKHIQITGPWKKKSDNVCWRYREQTLEHIVNKSSNMPSCLFSEFPANNGDQSMVHFIPAGGGAHAFPTDCWSRTMMITVRYPRRKIKIRVVLPASPWGTFLSKFTNLNLIRTHEHSTQRISVSSVSASKPICCVLIKIKQQQHQQKALSLPD